RDLARHASVFRYAFDLSELAVVDPDATAEELQLLEDCEVIVRDPQPGEQQRWRLRHSTLKDVVYASLPKRERLRLHQLVAGFLLDAGHPSFAADHLELAAFAAIDLDPNDRSVPDRAADALLKAGDRARRRMESRSASDCCSARWPPPRGSASRGRSSAPCCSPAGRRGRGSGMTRRRRSGGGRSRPRTRETTGPACAR